MADMPLLQGWLDEKLAYAVKLAVEDGMLNGPSPNGILASGVPLSASYTPPASPAPTGLDLIAGAISQLEASGYQPDGIVLSASDAFLMRILKTSIGGFLWSDPDSQLASKSMWNIPIVISPKMPAGKFAVGAFAQSCLFFTRQQAIVEISYENEDDFIHNLCCLSCECGGVLAIPVPQGIVVSTLPAGSMAASETRHPVVEPQHHSGKK